MKILKSCTASLKKVQKWPRKSPKKSPKKLPNFFNAIELPPRAVGVLECPDAQVSDQGAYSCEAINSKGSCFAGSPGCGQPGQVRHMRYSRNKM